MSIRHSARLVAFLFCWFLAGGAVLTGFSLFFYNGSAAFFLIIFCAYFLHGLSFSLLMLLLSYLGLRENSARRLTDAAKIAYSVSVAVPVFNEAGSIVTCIESILKQSIRN